MSAGDLRAHRRAVTAAGLWLVVVSALWHASLEPLRQARRGQVLQARAAAMIPGGTAAERVVLGAPRSSTSHRMAEARQAWRVLDRGGRPIGYVVPFEGPGFQQRFAGAVAVDPACERVVAVAVHEAHESPSEDLFERHPWFLRQLAGRGCRAPVRLAPAAAGGVHAISGASVSSHLLVRQVNEAVSVLRGTLEGAR